MDLTSIIPQIPTIIETGKSIMDILKPFIKGLGYNLPQEMEEKIKEYENGKKVEEIIALLKDFEKNITTTQANSGNNVTQINGNNNGNIIINIGQQNDDKILQEKKFSELKDELKEKIINFSFGNNSGYNALDELISELKRDMEAELVFLGRCLLSKIPEKIPDLHYEKIIEAYYFGISGEKLNKEAQNLKDDFIKNSDDRWEYIKTYIGSTHHEMPRQKEALMFIGMEQFYKIDFEERKNVIYSVCYQNIYEKFRGFINVYIKNLRYLIDFVIEIKDNNNYINYLCKNLSAQELMLIFYYCASTKCSNKFREKIKRIGLLNNLDHLDNRFVDSPSQEELNKEIENVLKEDNSIQGDSP